jgi:hypothetical protein
MKLWFDENGNAMIAENGGAPIPTIGSLGADPSSGVGGAPVLIYKLPEPVISGDAMFTEPGLTGPCSSAGTSGCSDILRFTDNTGVINGGVTSAGHTIMILYSDFETGELNAALADSGFPANAGTGNSVTNPEVGLNGKPYSEQNNGFDYQPGGVPYPSNNEFVGVSDAVPELGTWALMAIGFAGLGVIGYRRAKVRAALAAA